MANEQKEQIDEYPLDKITTEEVKQFAGLDTQVHPASPFSEDYYKTLIEYFSDNIRVIRGSDGNLKGFIYVLAYGIDTVENEDDPYGEIASIFVDEELRQKGLGQKLLAFGVERLKSKGVPRIQLHTEVDNISMQNLAKKLGFEVKETVPNYYQAIGKDAYLMELTNYKPTSVTNLPQ